MSKWSLVFLAIYGGLMLVQIGLMLPIHWFQWGVLLGLVGNCFRQWRTSKLHEERRDAIWGKYDRPSSSKVPHYHDL